MHQIRLGRQISERTMEAGASRGAAAIPRITGCTSPTGIKGKPAVSAGRTTANGMSGLQGTTGLP